MSGNSILLDTNAVLYLLGGKLLFEDLPSGNYCVSFISELELLSYHSLGDEEKNIRNFLNSIKIIDVSKQIKNATINIRQKYRLKLPDAIICATALVLDAIIVTNDKEMYKVKELRIH